jgi:hypothetical protein
LEQNSFTTTQPIEPISKQVPLTPALVAVTAKGRLRHRRCIALEKTSLGESSTAAPATSSSKRSITTTSVKKRKRVTFEQQMILQTEFTKDQEWTVEKMDELGERLNFTRAKIYKWHYDRVRRRAVAS